jgi:glyoxylase I family protein
LARNTKDVLPLLPQGSVSNCDQTITLVSDGDFYAFRGYLQHMAHISSSGIAHVRLTVTDIGRSKGFYDALFGWPVAIDASDSVDEAGVKESPEKFYGGVVYQTPQGTLFGLRPVVDAQFDSTRTGLDHLSFAVSARSDLEAAKEALSTAGITHGDITDLADAGICILSIQDPDDINIELTAPLP